MCCAACREANSRVCLDSVAHLAAMIKCPAGGVYQEPFPRRGHLPVQKTRASMTVGATAVSPEWLPPEARGAATCCCERFVSFWQVHRSMGTALPRSAQLSSHQGAAAGSGLARAVKG